MSQKLNENFDSKIAVDPFYSNYAPGRSAGDYPGQGNRPLFLLSQFILSINQKIAAKSG